MRLIDADALIEALNEKGVPYRADVQAELDNAPTADVVPVRHGHWIKISPAGIYECSECGKNVMTSDIKAYEYCHGCGARMDGDSDETD
jgi:hypothetical protein